MLNHLLTNSIFLKRTSQILIRKILCSITLLKNGPIFWSLMKKCYLSNKQFSWWYKFCTEWTKKYKVRLKKAWVTSGIQISICIKNKLLRKLINKKDPQIKTVSHEQYKTYKNLFSTLMKESKQIYYSKYFGNNCNKIKNIWEKNQNYNLNSKYHNCSASISMRIVFSN